MADALEQLKERLTEVQDLGKVMRVLGWDQLTMMPRAGVGHRAEQGAALQKIAHEKFTDPAVGKLLDELAPLEGSLDPDSDDAALIRLVRRDYQKAVNVPSSLRAEMARAASQANPVWVKAKAESDFASFLPSLQKNVELKLQYVELVADGADERYDVLLDDYEPLTKTAEVREVFAELKPPLVALIAELRDRDVDDSFLHGDYPVDRQRALAHEVVDLFGHRPDSWRIDPTEHPFASGPGRNDVRITTHYHPDSIKSLFSTMHEYGHGLYSHQQP
jgi:carboxypeptidase Taq